MFEPQVIFVKEVTLRAGASATDLETLWVEEFLPHATELPGFRPTMYKGQSPQKEGQYLYVNYFETAERRGELYLGSTYNEESKQWMPIHSEEMKEWVAANPAYQEAMSHIRAKFDTVGQTLYQELR
jgi:hypothetical protein